MRTALRRQEAVRAGDVPDFARIAARVAAAPSSLDVPRRPVAEAVCLAGTLAVAQFRVVPHAVLSAALTVAAAAVGAACLIGVASAAASAASWWFAALLLFGTALTTTLAMSRGRADALSLATPLGPQAVALARLSLVLGVDALAGIAASALFAWLASGSGLDVGAVAESWLAPLSLVAGIAALATVWSEASWAGALAGAAVVPLVLPAAEVAPASGIAALAGSVQNALGSVGMLAVGVALLAAVVCSSRRVALARLRAL
ncbi:hypothetical protein B5F40_10965 [Gordonibacter sp. An230]|nr:hypothetical protein B5F40_10965 [Gordonibacter sp. An230]